MRAIIVGAGIAGLATALRLSHAGWETLVVERAAARRGGGYAVTFGGIGHDGAERLGVLRALRDRSFVTAELAYRRPDGRLRFTLSGEAIAATMDETSFTILRGDIESVLFEAVRDRTTVRFGTTVTAVDQVGRTVTVTLSDGSTEHADLLVGADGLHSAVRNLVFGPEQQYLRNLGHQVGVYMLPRRPQGLADGASGTISDGGRTFAINSVGNGRTTAFFGYRTDIPTAAVTGDPRVALPAVYRDMGWLVPEALVGLRTADSVYFDTISQAVLERWSTGNVVLVGDAAWCVSLFAGYGSSLAVGGADALGTALERHRGDIPGALAEWERALRPDVERKQRLGRWVKDVYAPRSRLMLELTQLPLRLASWPPVRSLIGRHLQG
ncbi:FAD-dependent monooxygenase [Georgenia alba]|uniref:FAD-dependent monooxygenase n=1 Tax=Georgenia alba TaxID=2233858 RepID=A0ABW2QGT7_9MICO